MEVHTLFRTILFPNLKVKDITGEKISRGCVGPGEVIVPSGQSAGLQAERSGFETCQGHCVVF